MIAGIIILTMVAYVICGYNAIAEWVDNKDRKARKWSIAAATFFIVLITLIGCSSSRKIPKVQQQPYHKEQPSRDYPPY